MQRTFNSEDEVSEFGRMVEYRVKPVKEWGLTRDKSLQRHRDQVVKNMILCGEGLTLVLTPC